MMSMRTAVPSRREAAQARRALSVTRPVPLTLFAEANIVQSNIAGATMSNPRYTVDNLEPGESIGYLVKRCGALMTQIADRRFEATSVSFTQWIALMRLSE